MTMTEEQTLVQELSQLEVFEAVHQRHSNRWYVRLPAGEPLPKEKSSARKETWPTSGGSWPKVSPT